jgi:hypothetical protein
MRKIILVFNDDDIFTIRTALAHAASDSKKDEYTYFMLTSKVLSADGLQLELSEYELFLMRTSLHYTKHYTQELVNDSDAAEYYRSVLFKMNRQEQSQKSL